MKAKDYLKKSAIEAFSSSSGFTVDFMIHCVIALVLAIVFGILIYEIYKRFYGGVVYNDSFGVTLVGLSILTCTLTLAISSNIVISLGMVGALSIVRYRTAIKDPMDLLYLFWSISIGIIVAAQIYFLALAVMVIMSVLVSVFFTKKKNGRIYIMVVHYDGEDTEGEIIKLIGNNRYQLRSKTIRKGTAELTIELMSKQGSPAFVEKIDALEGVKDVSLIQYNGEYNG